MLVTVLTRDIAIYANCITSPPACFVVPTVEDVLDSDGFGILLGLQACMVISRQDCVASDANI